VFRSPFRARCKRTRSPQFAGGGLTRERGPLSCDVDSVGIVVACDAMFWVLGAGDPVSGLLITVGRLPSHLLIATESVDARDRLDVSEALLVPHRSLFLAYCRASSKARSLALWLYSSSVKLLLSSLITALRWRYTRSVSAAMIVSFVMRWNAHTAFSSPSASESCNSCPDGTSGSESRSPVLVPCSSELIPVKGVSPSPGVSGEVPSGGTISSTSENSIRGGRPP